MKRRFLNIILIFVIFFGLNSISYTSERDMANKIFRGDFKSFFIGTIIEEDNKDFIIKIDSTFMGKELDKLQVKKFQKYTFSVLKPAKNDIIVAILKNDGKLDETWIFKATSTNYKSLYLANDEDPDNEDFILFQNYINAGDYIEDREVTSKKENKNDEKEKEEKKDIIDENNKIKNKENSFEEFEKKTNAIYYFIKSPIKLIVIGTIFIVIFFVYSSSRNYRSDLEKDDFDDDNR